MNHASLFSGIGGPEIAAAMLGWDNVFHCEINDFGRKILEYWFPNSQSYEDIKTTNFKQWRGKVDVLTGGFPCQPFSYAGQRRGADDDRYLWPQMLRAIDEIRPAWVVGENVAGIVSMVEQGTVSHLASQATLFDEGDGVQRYRQEQTFTIERVCRDLEGLGYSVQPILVPACAVGAPHRRDRVFIIAHAQDPLHGGQLHGRDEEQGSERHIGDAGARGSERICGETPRTTSSNTFGRGEGTPREGGSLEGDGSDTHQQPSQWREPSEWSTRFYELLRYASDGIRKRLEREDEPRSGEGEERICVWGDASRCGGSYCEGRTTSDTSEQPGERMRPQQPEHRRAKQEQPGGRGGEDGGQRNVADTDNRFAQSGWSYGRSMAEPQGERTPRRCCDGGLRLGEGEQCGERWRCFPSVSPIHRGNDGLPFNVDDLTIPSSKWRTESLKAYGNAIVPQVMYEIFRAIQIIENQ